MQHVYTLADIAARFSLQLQARPGVVAGSETKITGLATLPAAGAGELTFFANTAYRRQLQETHAAAVILKADAVDDCPVPCLVAGNPYLAYAKVSALFGTLPQQVSGIHSSAIIHPSASIAG